MPDVFTKRKRSEVMARIRSRGNRDTELALAKLLRAQRISGWRRHVLLRATVDGRWLRVDGKKVEQGRARSPLRAVTRSRRHGAHGVTRPTFQVRPDFVFPKLKLAVFVDGCFWHGCPRLRRMPKNNAAFWRQKLTGNKARDRRVNRALRRAGWAVVRIWECELARALKQQATSRPGLLRRIQKVLAANKRELGRIRTGGIGV